jgi:hypothetical protein
MRIFIVALTMLVASGEALACRCITGRTLPQETALHDRVFVGQVTSISPSQSGVVVVSFKVSSSLKAEILLQLWCLCPTILHHADTFGPSSLCTTHTQCLPTKLVRCLKHLAAHQTASYFRQKASPRRRSMAPKNSFMPSPYQDSA